MPDAAKSLFIMVGDISADKHAAVLVKKLKEAAPDLHIWGSGGPDMAAAGFDRLYKCEDFAVIGAVEVMRRIGFFAKLRQDLVNHIARVQPDAVLLIDFGTFNLQLATAIKKRFPKMPILYFISPQVWGSRPWRMNTIAKNVDKMLVIFPFEEQVYRARGIQARFVGHPLTSNVPSREQLMERSEFCKSVGVKEKNHLVGVFAGSRKAEIGSFLPNILKAIETLCTMRPDVEFVISQGNAALTERIQALVAAHKLPAHVLSRMHFVDADSNWNLMANSDLVWAKSGTTALEAMLFGTPMLIFYRGYWISFLLVMIFKRVQRVGWPNLLAGKYLVPELVQLDCRAELFVRYTDDLLDVPALRSEIRAQLLTLQRKLGEGDYAVNCVEEILSALHITRQLPEPSQANV